MSADEIKTFRETRGWSQSELAGRLGVDQATVSRIERGAPMARTVALLLERLKAEPASSEPQPEAAA
jgi:transcriptional regulator with XRE-family HTH domain